MRSGKVGTVHQIISAVRFFVIAAVLQILVLLFLTPSGLALIYSFVMQFSSHNITVNDNAYVDYYVFRNELSSASVVSLAIDKSKVESYTLASDFLSSLKYSSNINAVALDEPYDVTACVSKCAFAESRDDFDKELEILSGLGASEGLLIFARSLYNANSVLPPQDKIQVECLSYDYYSGSARDAVFDALGDKIAAMPMEFRDMAEAGDVLAIREFLKEEGMDYHGDYSAAFDELILNADDVFVLPDDREESLSLRVSAVSKLHSDGVLYIIDRNSARDELFSCSENGRLLLDVLYSDDVKLPFVGEGFSCKLVKTADIAWFDKYYSLVVDPFGDGDSTIGAGGDYSAAYHFVISGK